MSVANTKLQEVRDHSLSQYVGSTKLNALLQGFVDLFQQQIVAHLANIDRALDVDNRSDFYLDWVGFRLGIVRPRIRNQNVVFFGLDGTESEGGRPLSQAPFFTTGLNENLYQNINDPAYRLVLKARARKLHGDLGMQAWEECLAILTSDGGGINVVQVSRFSVRLWFHDLPHEIREVVQSPVYGPQVLPMIPGVKYDWQETLSVQGVIFATGTNQPEAHSTL